jgi:hypothetical protein
VNGISHPNPAQVPILTEVIDLPLRPDLAVDAASRPVSSASLDALPVLAEVVSPLTEVAAQPTSMPSHGEPAVTEAQLAQRVLSDVQKQVDSMLEFRLKEAMAPLIARHTEAIARDLRDELSRTLKDVVARSVAQELAKLRQR